MRTRRRSCSCATPRRICRSSTSRASSITSKRSAACTSNATRRSRFARERWVICSCAPATGHAPVARSPSTSNTLTPRTPRPAASINNSCNSEVYLAMGSPMATGTMASVNEYLSASYRPDREYLDGVILERNVGEYDHANLQSALIAYLYPRRKELGIAAVIEQRVQVSPTRFRVPDVCVTPPAPEQIFTKPPFICIEILSPEDRLSAMQERVSDYLKMGVPYVWILDPKTRLAYRCTAEGMHHVTELRTENPAIVLPLADVFEA